MLLLRPLNDLLSVRALYLFVNKSGMSIDRKNVEHRTVKVRGKDGKVRQEKTNDEVYTIVTQPGGKYLGFTPALSEVSG